MILRPWSRRARQAPVLALVLLPAVALAHGPATAPGSDDDAPPVPGEVKAELVLSPPPAAFLPLPDGSVLLLDAERRRLLHVRGERLVAEAPLAGGAFEASRAHLVDLEMDRSGALAILDQAAGTVWLADPSGRVFGRRGLFEAPTRMRRGADGSLMVADPGLDRLVAIRPDGTEVSLVHAPGAAPTTMADGRIPYLRLAPDEGSLEVGLRPRAGALVGEVTLARLLPAPGFRVLDAEVLGVRGSDLVVRVRSYPTGSESQAPEDSAVWVVRALGPDTGSARRMDVPSHLNHCFDCGPDLRLGPDGSLWGYALSDTRYWVVRLAEEVIRW